MEKTSADRIGVSKLVIGLLKGVLYREDDEGLWRDLLIRQATVLDAVSVLGLELTIDEAEGYAFLSASESLYTEDSQLPRLVARRPLSFGVSLLLALLRKKLAEFDASGAETRLVITQADVVEMMRVFLPEHPNEIKLLTQIDGYLNKLVDLGFLRRLRQPGMIGTEPVFEVRRILKAFVDAQWLSDFDAKLQEYQAVMMRTTERHGSQEVFDEAE